MKLHGFSGILAEYFFAENHGCKSMDECEEV